VKIALAVLALVLPGMAAAQEPIFVTPPVTMYQFGGLVGADLEAREGGTALSTEVAFGALSPWTVSLHAVGVDGRDTGAQLARLHLGTRVRLLKRDRPREWLIVSVYGAAAVPLGDERDAVAEAHGVPSATLGASATRMARGGDAFVNLSVSRIPTPAGDLTSGTLGLAVGWRPRPGRYGDLEAQLFGEALGRYVERGAVSIGVAPGILVHARSQVLKLGVLIPVATRQESRDPTLKVSLKLFL
jgi:hypothetical protein